MLFSLSLALSTVMWKKKKKDYAKTNSRQVLEFTECFQWRKTVEGMIGKD